MTRSRYRFGDEHYPHFMTSTVVAWLPVFSYPEFANVILESWRFLQTQRDIEILAWVILENHIHWIGVGPKLSRRVSEFKSFTATSILKLIEQNGKMTLLQQFQYFKLKHKVDQQHQFWQEGSHPKMIETEEMMWQKIEYIHNNPLRRGYVDDPVHWRYSSARSYAGQRGLLDTVVDWR
ncbi:MAG: transposase [Planctomycetota bacterium]|nr:transposase [Planctomycetota bacterium]